MWVALLEWILSVKVWVGSRNVHQKSVYAKEVPDSRVDKVVRPVDITQPPPPATPVPAHEPLGHGGRNGMVSNQSILKEISPGISLEGMMLKLKLQYFGHLM